MLRVEVLLQEDGRLTVEEGLGCQTHRIAEEREVHVGVEVKMQLSGIRANHPCFCTKLEMEGATLRLAQLSAEADVVLCPFVQIADIADGVGHPIVGVVEGDEALQACLHVFVEAFKQ